MLECRFFQRPGSGVHIHKHHQKLRCRKMILRLVICLVHTADTDKKRLSCLVRVGGVTEPFVVTNDIDGNKY